MTQNGTPNRVTLSARSNGEALPPEAFLDPHIYQAELQGIFGQSWVHIADTFELSSPGDYVTSNIGEVSVVVVHGQDGKLRGFVNVCRHRGASLTQGAGNCGKQLKCPYHAWSYQTDGKLVGVPHRDEFSCNFDSLSLIPIRVDIAGPMVFGCLSEQAPALSDWAGGFIPILQRIFPGGLRPAFTFDYEVDVNWKIYVENGLEGYHIGFVHDMLDDFLPDRTSAEHVLEDHSSYTTTKLSEQVRSMAPPLEHLSEKDASSVRFGFIFPNLVPVMTPGDFSYLRVTPAGRGKIRLRGRSFDAGNVPSELLDFRKESFDRTNRQDISVVTRVEEGMRAGLGRVPGFVHSSHLERRIGHFESLWSRMLQAPAFAERRHLPVSGTQTSTPQPGGARTA